MLKIGIAGYMGAGKSLVASLFAKQGATVIDADLVAKNMMNENKELRDSIENYFGTEVIDNNQINFSVLGRIVFSCPKNLSVLNSLVHPKLLIHFLRIIKDYRNDIIILDAALIPFWHIDKWFDKLIWVDAKKKLRCERIHKKTSMGKNIILSRMQFQEALFPAPHDIAWSFIDNNQSDIELRKSITLWIENLKSVEDISI